MNGIFTSCSRNLSLPVRVRQDYYNKKIIITFSTQTTTAQQCPYANTNTHTNTNNNTKKKTKHVKLNHIPSLPFLGSTISSYSGIKFDFNDLFAVWPAARKKFGEFYTIGIPGRGSDINGTVHIIQDPQEMMKVLHAEGKYPTSSSAQGLWTFRNMYKEYGFGRPGEIMGQGEDWKLIRSFLQNDLLSPQSANRYLPGILESVKFISKGMPHHAHDLNNFLKLASFDMFCSVLLGAFPRITDPDTVVDPDDDAFCHRVANVISIGSNLTVSPREILLNKMGIKSKAYIEMYNDWTQALDYGMKKIVELETKKENGLLTDSEEASYWNQAIKRWEEGDTGLTKEEVNKICLILFNLSVDTTSTKTAWHLLHVGLNEEVQNTLYAELQSLVQESDGNLTPEIFAESKSPYLNAIIRESNRLTCPANLAPIRKLAKDVEVHGHILKAGSVVAFDQMSKSMDPELVEDPFSFRPERFLPDAVEARKGTKSEFLDHPLFSGPFGQGARRCPGSRVARNESMALIAQCVLDWKFVVPGFSHYREVPYGREGLISGPKLPLFLFESRN